MKKVISLFLSLVMICTLTTGLTFTAQAATAINSVTVTGVDKPIPGKPLDYTVAVSGEGYALETNISPNAVTWYDLSVSSTKSIPSDSKFINGHNYLVSVRLIADGMHEFSDNVSAKIGIGSGTYNADVMGYSTFSQKNVIVVSKNIKCEYNKISTVTLSGDYIKKGDVLNNDHFVSLTQGVTVITGFTRNGEAIMNGEKVTLVITAHP